MKKSSKILQASFRDYFTFSRRERRGIVIFILILSLQCVILFWMHYFPLHPELIITDNFESELDQQIISDSLALRNSTFKKPDLSENSHHFQSGKADENVPYSDDSRKSLIESTSQTKVLMEKFDPNSIDKAQWMLFGLSAKQASIILRFLEKGGKFRVKQDLQKIYSIKYTDYLRMEPYILLPDSGDYYKKKDSERKQKNNPLRIDLAKADSLEILRLPGIGPGFTHRILTYREKLGGFCSLEQLHEIWGMNDSLFNAVQSFVFLSDTIPFRLIELNKINFDELKLHPYVGFKLARILLNYRDQHGPFHNMNDLNSIPLIPQENLRKLAGYLSFVL